MAQLSLIPFFSEIEESQNILLAGAGGGFDIYSGIPLYFSLKELGKSVTLANFSFTWLAETSAPEVYPYLYKIEGSHHDHSGRNYFPEKYLAQWLGLQGEFPDIYAFARTGVNPLKDAYKYLIKKHAIDTIILVDGGTDSLMFGDEEGLGTPQEDVCSIAAVYRSGVSRQFLVSVGFGIDHYHGVSHYHFLENVAALDRSGGYFGLFQMISSMPEAQYFADAIAYANKRMPGMESIVSNSIDTALSGEYGNVHRTKRTQNSVLWINPLMTIFWCFDLRKVVHQIKYFDLIRDVNTIGEFNGKLAKYRSGLGSFRKKKNLPL
ncbi:MAG: DUF1152 domain-containing protein [Bacteroidota bacterium]